MTERVFRGWIPGLPGCPQAGMSATRDASWFNKPGRAYKRHVVAGDGGSACCGMPLVLDYGVEEAARTEGNLRCQRRGCKERWP